MGHELPKVAVMTGSGGAVASVDAVASQVGIDVLEAGGNATDAAIATAAALGVTEPYSTGIGGGGFFVHRDASTGAVETIDGRETAPATYDETTFEALRTWRMTVATETKVPAYVVFTDATLTAIAERKPSDIAALATISGVGAAKLARFGESVLSILGGADPVLTAQNASAAAKSEALDAP